MSESKHTPGPWDNTPSQPTIWANDGELKVATIADLPWKETSSGKPCSDWQTENANARLIAAAPELLAACELLVKWTNEPTNTHPLEAAKAAIAKAKGL